MQYVNVMPTDKIEDALKSIFNESDSETEDFLNPYDTQEVEHIEQLWIKYYNPQPTNILINHIPLKVKSITIHFQDETYLDIQAIFNETNLRITLEQHEIIDIKPFNF